MLLDPTFNCHIYLSIRKDYVSYCDNHGGMKPEKIVMKTKIYNILDEIDIFEKDDVLSLWGIPAIRDDTIDTAWKFVGAPVLEHKKCMLCGIVVGRKVHGHSLDGKWVCEHCYDRVRGTIDERWQKIVFENNERVAKSMSKEYFESYKDLLFGDAADWSEYYVLH